MKGLFIVMEGPDGSGKTTQINLLEQYLKEAGYECLIAREPGGTVIGEEVRELILNPEYKEMSPVTEMLLYAASRAQLVHEVFIVQMGFSLLIYQRQKEFAARRIRRSLPVWSRRV